MISPSKRGRKGKRMKVEWKSCFRVGVSIFLLYLCIYYWSSAAGLLSALLGAAMPLLLGCVIAYMINILMSFYEKHCFSKSVKPVAVKCRRPVCMIGAIASLLAIVVLIIWLIVPRLSSCVQLLLAEVPGALGDLVAWVNQQGILPENISESLASVDWQSKIKQIIDVLASGIGNVTDVVVGVVSSVISGIVTAVMAIIFAIYLLMGKDTIGSQCKRLMNRYIKKNRYDKIMHAVAVVDDCFHRYIVGQCTEAVILGILCTVGMLILQLPYATMIGTLIAFTALIPIAGAYIGGGLGAFMIFTVSPVKAIIFLVFLVILQQVEGNLIYPRVVGSSIGLPAIWVLAAVTVGGGIMGVAGMLLGVPIAAAIYKLLREAVNQVPEGGAALPDRNGKELP